MRDLESMPHRSLTTVMSFLASPEARFILKCTLAWRRTKKDPFKQSERRLACLSHAKYLRMYTCSERGRFAVRRDAEMDSLCQGGVNTA